MISDINTNTNPEQNTLSNSHVIAPETHPRDERIMISTLRKRWNVIKVLLNGKKLTKYELGKVTNTSYNLIWQTIRELEFSRLITSKKMKSENGELYDYYFIPQEVLDSLGFVSADKIKMEGV